VRALEGTYGELVSELFTQPRVYSTAEQKWKGGPVLFSKTPINPGHSRVTQAIECHLNIIAPHGEGQKHGHMNSAVFFVLKGTYVNARVEDASFWRLMMPAYPAFVVLVAAVPLLIPGMRARTAAAKPWQVSRRLVVAVSVVLVAALSLFPIALVAATKPIRGSNAEAFVLGATLVPTSAAFHPRLDVADGRVRLQWQSVRSRAGTTSYTIYRRSGDHDVFCGPIRNAPDLCTLYADRVGTTRATTFVDHPGKGTWTYRIGVTANWIDDPKAGDVYVFGPQLNVNVR
jgi:hypothetical protein